MDKKSVIALLLAAVLAGAAGGEIGDQVVDTMQLRRLWTPGFLSSQSPTDSFNYGYRLCMENGSIVTVGDTTANLTLQTADITSSVTPQTTHIILYVIFESTAGGDVQLDIYTQASQQTNISMICPDAVETISQMIILPFRYTEDGNVYYQMDNAGADTETRIYLWGYFEMPVGEIR